MSQPDVRSWPSRAITDLSSIFVSSSSPSTGTSATLRSQRRFMRREIFAQCSVNIDRSAAVAGVVDDAEQNDLVDS